ncbi:unnamed protein product [Closterium sp. NIES-54]
MASLRVLAFDHEGRPIQFDTWLDDLQLYLLSDSKDSVSLFDLTSCAATAPPATVDSATRSQWLTRDAAARLAICNHLPLAKCAHFGQHRTAQALYDAVVARYSSPATAALGSLLLPLPQDHFLSLDPTSLTVHLLEQHLLATETSAVAVGAACGTPRAPFFEGCSPSPLAPTYASAAAADVPAAENVAAPSASGKHRSRKGKGGRGGGGGSGGGGGGSSGGSGSSGGGGSGGSDGGSGGSGGGGGGSGGSGGTGSSGTGGGRTRALRGGSEGGQRQQQQLGARPSRPSNFVNGCFSVGRLGVVVGAQLLRYGVAIFDLDFDAILTAMYALSVSAAGDCYRCVPSDPSIAAAALSASESSLPGTVPAEALHTFTLDSGLHLPSFSMNLVSTAALQDSMVTTTTPGGQRVSIGTCTQTGCHLATFTRRPGSSLYTLATFTRLPRSLPPLPTSPAPPCLPCVMEWQRAAPHSSFPPTTAPLQTLHMDVWGPAHVSGQCRERYFLLAVDDYTRYTMVFPLRSKGEVPDVLIPWIRAFSSDLLRYFCRGEGITQSFTLPASPQENGIAERRIGLVMEVVSISMIHVAAPHFLWPFVVGYAAHQLNLWPRVSLPETSPTLRWTGKVGDAPVFRVWGSRAFVHDMSADKLSPCAIPCVFLGFPFDAPGWQFYHPTSHRVLPSQDVTFDESVPFYRLFPYRSAPPPPPPLFLTPGPPPVDPLPPQGLAPSGVSQVEPLPGTALVEVAGDSGAARGAAFGGLGPGGAEPGGAESEVAGSGGAGPGGVEPREGVEFGGAEPRGAASSGGRAVALPEPLSTHQLREWLVWHARLQSGATGAGGTGGTAAAGPGGPRTRGARAAGTGRAGGAGAGAPTEPGATGAGAGGARAGGAKAGGTGAGGAGARGIGARGAGVGGVGAVDPGAGGAGGTMRP